MLSLRIIYAANIIVAGWIGVSGLFFPKNASVTVFSGAYSFSEVMRLVGSLWLAIAILSVLGLWRPLTFSPVLLLQLLYKASWLLFVALPAMRNHQSYPVGMAIFFLVWVLLLPFIIPWKEWFC